MEVKTREQVVAELNRKGMAVAEWARRHGVDASVVYELLSGRTKGHRGEAHRAAVLLGLKDGEIVSSGDHTVNHLDSGADGHRRVRKIASTTGRVETTEQRRAA